MTGAQPARVAVIGASGIGKHHARWWALCGAEVCAIAGSTRASVARAKAGLEAQFDFRGQAYAGVDTMLRNESPDIVDVCSPPSLHYEHATAALNAGCHVLCEKPFVFDSNLSSEALMNQARELVERARKAKLRLSVCCQYAQGAQEFLRLWKGREKLVRFYSRLETPARDRAPDPRRIWVDLSPHPISVLLALAPRGHVDWTTLTTSFTAHEATARFQYPVLGASPVQCEIVVRNSTRPSANVRHFKLNDCTFDVDGVKGSEGVYSARIRTPYDSYIEMDMMHALIRDFLHHQPVVNSAAMMANLAIMTRILEVTP